MLLRRIECGRGQQGLHALQIEQLHGIVGASFQCANGKAQVDISPAKGSRTSTNLYVFSVFEPHGLEKCSAVRPQANYS